MDLSYVILYIMYITLIILKTKNMETPATNNNILTEEEIEAIFQEEGNTTAVSSERQTETNKERLAGVRQG